MRSISYSEISTALTCPARWDFRYGGHLAGDALAPKLVAPQLREGRAWGAAVAVWHQHSTDLLAGFFARRAVQETLSVDLEAIEAAGGWKALNEVVEMEERLGAMLDDYARQAVLIPDLHRLEDEIEVGVPSRTGRQSSTLYRYLCRIDGYTEERGRWLVEFKLRRQLTPIDLIQMNPQHRWYAWAHQHETGEPIIGVLIDERLNAVPVEPRILKNGHVSQDKHQMTTPAMYARACETTDTPVDPEVVEALAARSWQQQVPIQFRPSELEEAGRELTSAARLIRDLDSGDLAPIRNAARARCSGCEFRSICPNPTDRLLIDANFKRVAPKRLRTAA